VCHSERSEESAFCSQFMRFFIRRGGALLLQNDSFITFETASSIPPSIQQSIIPFLPFYFKLFPFNFA